MGTYLTVGISHRAVALEMLERVAAVASASKQLQEEALEAGCAEVMVLSTCSRTEIHAVLDTPAIPQLAAEAHSVARKLIGLLVGSETVYGPRLADRATVAIGDDAVTHLFRVAAGLESRVVGEVEIQAQLRASARGALSGRGEPHRLRRLTAAALAAAQSLGEEHRLSEPGRLAQRAVARAFAELGPRTPVEVLVVGAGTMGRQVVDALAPYPCRPTLLSRSSTARSASAPKVHPLEELPLRLAAADLVFVATSAGRRLLSSEQVRFALQGRPGRRLVLFDLSVPRNVDPDVQQTTGVRLLDLDDLQSAEQRDTSDIAAVELAVLAAAESFCAEVRSRAAGPLIAALRSRIEEVCLDQLQRAARGHALTDEALARMASSVAGAVAHSPTLLARNAAAEGDSDSLALLAAAFRLEGVTSDA